MASDQLDALIAGSARTAFTPQDISNSISGLNKSYWEGLDQAAKNKQRDAFKNGVPTDKDGNPDYASMAKTLYQNGAIGEGNTLSNIDIQRQMLKRDQDSANYVATGDFPPSASRQPGTPVAAPLGPQGGGQPAPQPQPASQATTQGPRPPANAPTSLVSVINAAGIPDEKAGPVITSLARQIGVDPNGPLDTNDPRVRNVLVPALQMAKRQLGIPDQAQPGQTPPQQPQVAQAQPPQMQQPAAQAGQAPNQPNPFANAVAAGLIPPGVDPQRYYAGLKYIAASPSAPGVPANRQQMARDTVAAIDKANAVTEAQKNATPQLAQFEAQKTAGVERAKSDVKEQDGIIAAGQEASKRLTTLNTVSNIINSDKDLTLGYGGETALKVKKALQQIGINVGDLSGAQTIEKLNAQLASEAAKSISPRPAQFEFKTFLANNPGLSMDKAGNLRVLGIFSQLAKRDVDLGRLARQNGQNWGGWDNVVEKYDKTNPIIDPVSKQPISTDSIVAPGPVVQAGSAKGSGTQTVSSKADYDKLPSGTQFTGPDGKPWRKP